MTRTPRPVDCGLRDADSKTTGQHIDFTRVAPHMRNGDLQKHVQNVSDGLDLMLVIVVRNQSHPPGKLTCGYMIQTMQRKILREASLENGIFYM